MYPRTENSENGQLEQEKKKSFEEELEQKNIQISNLRTLVHHNMAQNMSAHSELDAAKQKIAEEEKQKQHNLDTISKLKSELQQREKEKKALQSDIILKEKEKTDLAQKLNKKISTIHKANAELNTKLNVKTAETRDLKRKLKIIKNAADQTPLWKYILGGLLGIAGVLLIASGLGAPIGLPMVFLSWAFLSVGASILAGELLYGVYKIGKACFPPQNLHEIKPPSPVSDDKSLSLRPLSRISSVDELVGGHSSEHNYNPDFYSYRLYSSQLSRPVEQIDSRPKLQRK